MESENTKRKGIRNLLVMLFVVSISLTILYFQKRPEKQVPDRTAVEKGTEVEKYKQGISLAYGDKDMEGYILCNEFSEQYTDQSENHPLIYSDGDFTIEGEDKPINVNIKMYIYDQIRMYKFAYSSS